MQCPPSPGPGLKDMKPKGFVAAASMTSQTSMFIRSQSCASSLTSAMFTERKMFSRSFVSSAASGDETGCTLSIAAPYSADGRGGRALVDPADDLRDVLRRPVLAARVDALGGERQMEVLAGGEPAPSLEDRLHLLARRARIGRRLEDDEMALAQACRDLLGGGDEDAQIGLALPRERCRERDEDRVRLAELVVVRRRRDEAGVDERASAPQWGRPRCSSRPR